MGTGVFFNIPAHGHINPTLPVVRELTARGERIVYHSTETFRDKIERSGAEFAAYRFSLPVDQHRGAGGNLARLGERLMESFEEIMAECIDALRGLAPDYVIHDAMCPWGKFAARYCGVTAVNTVSTFVFTLATLPELAVLIATGSLVDTNDLGSLPENVVLAPYVPQLEVLERASLFVSHGGMNSVNESLYFGVPLMLVPQQAEQYVVARRVEALGAGVCLDAEATSATLSEAASRLLGNGQYAEKARKIGATLRSAGGHQAAATHILAYTRA